MRFVNAAAAALVLLLAGAVHGQDEPVSSASPAPTPSNSASSDTAASTGSADQQPTPTPTPTGTTDGSSSSLPSPSGYPDSDLDPATRCQPDQLVAGPFCSPKPHDVWRTDGNYYVTWDNDRWALNSTVIITLNYDEQGGAGPVVKDYTFPNSRGFLTIHPEKDWLLNRTLLDTGVRETVTNQSLYFVISCDDAATPGARGPHTGPSITLTSQPHAQPVDTSPNNRPAPSFLGLAVGLPLVFAFILTGVCGTHFCMKQRRQIGPIHIGGGARRFRRGYSGRAARRQRAAAAGYQDEPGDLGEEQTLPPSAPRRDWELANVKGGRSSIAL